MSKLIQKIGEEIKKECEEHCTINGDRFYGVSFAQVSKILRDYGFIDDLPF